VPGGERHGARRECQASHVRGNGRASAGAGSPPERAAGRPGPGRGAAAAGEPLELGGRAAALAGVHQPGREDGRAGLRLRRHRLGGALSLSSRDADDFSQLADEVIALYTAPAAAIIAIARRQADASELAGQLDQAAASRAVIDQAIGIVMAESRCAADQALATLTRASDHRNMKLRDLATEIVMRVGSRPPSRTAR